MQINGRGNDESGMRHPVNSRAKVAVSMRAFVIAHYPSAVGSRHGAHSLSCSHLRRSGLLRWICYIVWPASRPIVVRKVFGKLRKRAAFRHGGKVYMEEGDVEERRGFWSLPREM